jgi:hypothetical protein
LLQIYLGVSNSTKSFFPAEIADIRWKNGRVRGLKIWIRQWHWPWENLGTNLVRYSSQKFPEARNEANNANADWQRCEANFRTLSLPFLGNVFSLFGACHKFNLIKKQVESVCYDDQPLFHAC